MKVKVYVEGGGNGRELRAKCRRGFSSFFCSAGFGGRLPKVIACGGRQRVYEKFSEALDASSKQEFIVLLADEVDAIQGWFGISMHRLDSSRQVRRSVGMERAEAVAEGGCRLMQAFAGPCLRKRAK